MEKASKQSAKSKAIPSTPSKKVEGEKRAQEKVKTSEPRSKAKAATTTNKNKATSKDKPEYTTDTDSYTDTYTQDYAPLTVMPKPSNIGVRIALAVSVVLHLGLLTVKFAGPEAIDDFFKAASLEVILMNARSDAAPTEAKLLAQENFAGGGDAVAENQYTASPLEYYEEAVAGDSFEDSLIKTDAKRQESVRVLNAAKSAYSHMPPIDPSWGEDDPRRVAEEERRRELSNQIAALEQRIQEESSRPRRMVIGPSARKDAKAMYFDAIRKKIETKGTESFPQHEGKPIYGQLVMEIVINPKGDLVSAKVTKSADDVILNRLSGAIVASAAPFQAAPTELLKLEKNVEFVFRMRFSFLKDGQVSAELLEKAKNR